MLFRYPLFLHNLRPRPLFRYCLFLLGKNKDGYSDILYFYLTQIETSGPISSVPTLPKLLFKFPLFLLGKNQDGYSDNLYFYLTQIQPAIQISTIPTQPKTKTAILISSISIWKKSGLLFRCPRFQPDTNRDRYFNILHSYLA